MNKKRVNCDYNCYELITSYYYDNPEIQNIDELLNYEPTKIVCNDLQKYKNNLKKSKKNNNYYDYYLSLKQSTIELIDIETIYLVGKSFSKYEDIKNLNKNYDVKETKSDIYIKIKNGSYIGISIKQDNKCCETNYSVYKFFTKVQQENLKTTFNDILDANGIKDKNSKHNRIKINTIFYNRDNIYFNLLKEMIELNKNKIIKDLLKYLYSNEVNYDIYKFNGSQFYKINGINNFDNVIFSECDDFYKDKNGNQRKCAKMFYKLMVNNDIYRVEIRWKGNFSASPQFLCYLYNN